MEMEEEKRPRSRTESRTGSSGSDRVDAEQVAEELAKTQQAVSHMLQKLAELKDMIKEYEGHKKPATEKREDR